ncbi:hypothetical protein [Anaeromicrobium sediminis]|uniref:Uncharacterized protein n=1 Tax=Anaeromicrobium sediminis TaxID=1478221 RepID=A0A267MIQ0_9FIRM|nr:hypothetical protein [Anaeromicrobium sediminis]PAB58673.1 hypothetical protein CCE28_14440 [Anaeromicrobium sediminis]
MSIKWRTLIATTVLGIFMLSIFPLKCFANNKNNEINNLIEHNNIKNNKDDISKEQIINWIEEQGEKDRYYYGGLSYELVNLDNDSELEVVVKTEGGVHLGDFFIFDKKQDKKYHLIIEQDWKVESWNLYNPIADPPEVGYKKIFEIVTTTGGTGIDIHEVRLWYIEDGKFIQAWKGILKDRLFFLDYYSLKIGDYQFDHYTHQIYAWLSSYKYKIDGFTLEKSYGTNTMTYKFDGTHFILDTETGYIKMN